METNPRLRDTILVPIGFLAILLIFKFTGVIATYSMAIGIAATLALMIAIKILPSRSMRVIAGLLIATTMVSIVVPWFLSSYFPYTKEGLKERRELTDSQIGEKVGGDATTLTAIRKYCRDTEKILSKRNSDLLAQGLEKLRAEKPETDIDLQAFEKNLKILTSSQEVRKICSDHLKEKNKVQVSAEPDSQDSGLWSSNKWFLLLAILLVAVWFIGAFYAIHPLHKTAVLILFVLLVCWLVLGSGVATVEKIYNSDEAVVGQQAAQNTQAIAPPTGSTTSSVAIGVKSVTKATKGLSADLLMFIAAIVFLIVMHIIGAHGRHSRRRKIRITAWTVVFVAYVIRFLAWMAMQGTWENIFKAFS